MMKNRAYRDVVEEELDAHGITKWIWTSAKKSLRCSFLLPDGRTRFTTIPSTPSDSRFGSRNKRGDIRRELRSYGVKRIKETG